MIDVELLRTLRARTDASVALCKSALEKANGDIEHAARILQEEGSRVAEKKSVRSTGAGIVDAYVHATRHMGALLEIHTETDFVARNPEFQTLAHDIAMHIAAASPRDTDELLSQPFIKDEAKTIQDLLNEAIARFGENIQIGGFSRLEV